MAAARVERRLAAIVAVDVAGYSRLMARDEAETFARLKRTRREVVEPALARHGGRFVDLKPNFNSRLVTFQVGPLISLGFFAMSPRPNRKCSATPF